MDNPEAQQHWTQNKTNEYKKKTKQTTKPKPKKEKQRINKITTQNKINKQKNN
jgi:hypothetical protein